MKVVRADEPQTVDLMGSGTEHSTSHFPQIHKLVTKTVRIKSHIYANQPWRVTKTHKLERMQRYYKSQIAREFSGGSVINGLECSFGNIHL